VSGGTKSDDDDTKENTGRLVGRVLDERRDRRELPANTRRRPAGDGVEEMGDREPFMTGVPGLAIVFLTGIGSAISGRRSDTVNQRIGRDKSRISCSNTSRMMVSVCLATNGLSCRRKREASTSRPSRGGSSQSDRAWRQFQDRSAQPSGPLASVRNTPSQGTCTKTCRHNG
jgi:hypothetical protein